MSNSIKTVACQNENCNGVLFLDESLVTSGKVTTFEGKTAYCVTTCISCKQEFLVVPSYDIIKKPIAEKYWVVSNAYYGNDSEKIFSVTEATRTFDEWCDQVYDDTNVQEHNETVKIDLSEYSSDNQRVLINSKTISFDDED